MIRLLLTFVGSYVKCATIAFVTRTAKCDEDDLPIVFVAGDVVGTFRDLVQFDVNWQLVKAVFGTSAS